MRDVTKQPKEQNESVDNFKEITGKEIREVLYLQYGNELNLRKIDSENISIRLDTMIENYMLLGSLLIERNRASEGRLMYNFERWVGIPVMKSIYDWIKELLYDRYRSKEITDGQSRGYIKTIKFVHEGGLFAMLSLDLIRTKDDQYYMFGLAIRKPLGWTCPPLKI